MVSDKCFMFVAISLFNIVGFKCIIELFLKACSMASDEQMFYLCRYINHARHHPNLRLMHPVMIGEKLRIGFVALRSIRQDEELFFNYCIKDKDLEWLKTDAKRIASTMQDGTCKVLLFAPY